MSAMMSPTPVAPGSELLPFRWTAAAFNELGDQGVFEGRRPILLDGVILEQGPMKPPHADALELVDAAIRTAFGTGWRFRGQSPFDVGAYTNPMPDLAVVAPGPRGEHPKTAAFIVEVADSTMMTDTTTKAELYTSAGVPEYWVLDLVGRRLLVFRHPEPLPKELGATTYREHSAHFSQEQVAPLAVPDRPIRVADLLP